MVKKHGNYPEKILIFGAGVLGSLNVARLKQAGQDVTILARNARVAEIKAGGITLEHPLTGKRDVIMVPVVEHLYEIDRYDLIVVLVRKNQVASVLPILAAYTASSLSDYGNRRQKLAAQSQILPIFYVNIEHIESKMGEIWVVQADFEPI